MYRWTSEGSCIFTVTLRKELDLFKFTFYVSNLTPFKWNFPDINECTERTHDCHEYASCTDTDGSFTCTCNTGFSGDGKNCEGQFTFLFMMYLYMPNSMPFVIVTL